MRILRSCWLSGNCRLYLCSAHLQSVNTGHAYTAVGSVHVSGADPSAAGHSWIRSPPADISFQQGQAQVHDKEIRSFFLIMPDELLSKKHKAVQCPDTKLQTMPESHSVCEVAWATDKQVLSFAGGHQRFNESRIQAHTFCVCRLCHLSFILHLVTSCQAHALYNAVQDLCEAVDAISQDQAHCHEDFVAKEALETVGIHIKIFRVPACEHTGLQTG